MKITLEVLTSHLGDAITAVELLNCTLRNITDNPPKKVTPTFNHANHICYASKQLLLDMQSFRGNNSEKLKQLYDGAEAKLKDSIT